MRQPRVVLHRLPSPMHLLPLSLLQSHLHQVSKSSFSILTTHPHMIPESQVYSITTLLHLAHDPEIKLVSMVQREKIRETSPEIVMSRKMRKSLEFNAIQERLRVRALVQPTENIRASDHPHSTPSKSSLKLPQQPQRQRLRAKRQPSPNKAMEEASWRIFRLPFVAV